MKRTTRLPATALIALSLLLSACRSDPTATTTPPATSTPPTSAPPPVPLKTVTISFIQEPDSLNPLYTVRWFSFITRELWLKGLWSFDDASNPVPELAAGVPSRANGGLSADGQTITVKLRPDLTWSDGQPLTADDFVFTYEMILSENNSTQVRYPYKEFVSAVTALDDHTLQIEFSQPLAAWLTTLFTYVLPRHILEPVFEASGTLDNAAWNLSPTVGAGPFVFEAWEPGEQIILARNPNWADPPRVERVILRILPDNTAQLAALETGEVDIGVLLTYDDVAALETLPTLKVVAVPSGYEEGWFFNLDSQTGHPALQDPLVRHALALATDRWKIASDLLHSLTEPPATLWDATTPYGNPGIQPYPYDPDEAASLLDQAGWLDTDGDGVRDRDGVKLTLRYVTTRRPDRLTAQAAVQQMWAAVGIEARLVNYPDDVIWQHYGEGGPLATGQYDVAQYALAGAFPDPEASDAWLCDQIPGPQNPEGLNWQGYCNPELDALLQAQASTVDPEKRRQHYFQIEQIMYDEKVWVGLWRDPDLWAINQRLTGVRLSGATPFWNAAEWELSN